MAEATNFRNTQNEVACTTSPAPAINQNIIVADNTFTTDRPQAMVNVSSANDVVFYYDALTLTGDQTPSTEASRANSSGLFVGPRQFPLSVHDATHVFFGELSCLLFLAARCRVRRLDHARSLYATTVGRTVPSDCVSSRGDNVRAGVCGPVGCAKSRLKNQRSVRQRSQG